MSRISSREKKNSRRHLESTKKFVDAQKKLVDPPKKLVDPPKKFVDKLFLRSDKTFEILFFVENFIFSEKTPDKHFVKTNTVDARVQSLRTHPVHLCREQTLFGEQTWPAAACGVATDARRDRPDTALRFREPRRLSPAPPEPPRAVRRRTRLRPRRRHGLPRAAR